MNTCKDCICYPVCCKYDMYGDCAKECKHFAGGKDWVKPVRCKDCKHCRVTTLQNRYGVKEKAWLCSYFNGSEDTEEIVEEDGYCSNGRRNENA